MKRKNNTVFLENEGDCFVSIPPPKENKSLPNAYDDFRYGKMIHLNFGDHLIILYV